MKKIFIFLLGCMFGILIFIISKTDEFIGTRCSEPGIYSLEFDSMNETDTDTQMFHKGDEVDVFFDIKKGDVNLWIGKEEKVVFKGNHIDHGEFTLVIEKDGEYTIRVDGRKAKGKIEVQLKNQLAK